MNVTLRIAVACLAVSAFFVAPSAQARSHCYCKMQSPSGTAADFGSLGSYGTQQGHDEDCRKLCDGRASDYWKNNQGAACTASKGATLVANYAVGTRGYQAGNNYTCPQSGTSAVDGFLSFDNAYPANGRWKLNGNDIVPDKFGNVTLDPHDSFVNFAAYDSLGQHSQAWTYTAKLFRDDKLVQEFSRKCKPLRAFGENVEVRFASQSPASAHGRKWRIEMHWFGSPMNNRSIEFTTP